MLTARSSVDARQVPIRIVGWDQAAYRVTVQRLDNWRVGVLPVSSVQASDPLELGAVLARLARAQAGDVRAQGQIT